MKLFIKKTFLSLIIVLSIVSCAKKKEVDKLEGLTPEQLYSDGMKNMNSSQYGEAINYFDRINQEYPYSSLASKSQLMEGYAYYKLAKFEYAIAALDDYISLYPGEKDIEYAYYLKALCYYDQILNVNLDQEITEKAKDSLNELINRFPDSKYSRDGRFKLNLVLDHLAGKEMEIGRFYLKDRDIIGAINRFNVVVEKYQTTSQIEEALYRLVECYHILGVDKEARKYAAVLGDNYPEGKWYRYAYKLMKQQKENK
ncbi:MAG: outer membrane protein assembly factor BamD [Pseudomonadota bacterium]